MSEPRLALLARLEARTGKEGELAAFLRSALPLARNEAGTTTWFAFRMDETTFGIFDTFEDEAGREAHLAGPIARALMDRAPELLAGQPEIRKVDVLAAKLS